MRNVRRHGTSATVRGRSSLSVLGRAPRRAGAPCAIGSPASAARKAACSAMLRMLPPGTFEPREPVEVETPSSGAAAREDARARCARRCAASGNGNSTTKRSRRRNARSSALLRLRGEDRQAAVRLHPLQQVVDLDVGVAVVAVLDLAALAEQRVGLVEEQDRAAVLGRVEDAAQVLLGLADVLAHHAGEVDPVEVEPQLARRAPRRPSSCRCRSAPANSALITPSPRAPGAGEAPGVVDRRAVAHLRGDLAQRAHLPRRAAPGRPSVASARSAAARSPSRGRAVRAAASQSRAPGVAAVGGERARAPRPRSRRR